MRKQLGGSYRGSAYLHDVEIAKSQSQSVKSLQSLAGKLAWAGRVLPVGRRLTKAIHNDISTLKNRRGTVSISGEANVFLSAWSIYLGTLIGKE